MMECRITENYPMNKSDENSLSTGATDLLSSLGRLIDLSETPAKLIFNQELRKVILRGKLDAFVVPDKCNIIESHVNTLHTNSVNFSGCDFKDSTFTVCSFDDTKFVNSGIVQNTLTDCVFTGSDFHNTVIQSCEFYNVEFRNCDFTNLLIKDCLFAGCRFIDCRTMNKLFEMCLLQKCNFERTQLQIQTVTENLGLRKSEIKGELRSDRLDHVHYQMGIDKLQCEYSSATDPFARLGLYYYLKEDLLSGSSEIDAILDVSFWQQIQSTIGSFSTLLTRLCDFLLYLHEQDEIAYLPLIQTYHLTGVLASSVGTDVHIRQAEFAIYGTFLSIARRMEPFRNVMQCIVDSGETNWTFLVVGKYPESFYQSELKDLFDRGDPKIVSLVPHNSPWEMALSFADKSSIAAFMALFLATRTRLELQRILKTVRSKGAERPVTSDRESLALLAFGGATDAGSKSLFRVVAPLSPTLAIDFELLVSTILIGRIRKIVISLLK